MKNLMKSVMIVLASVSFSLSAFSAEVDKEKSSFKWKVDKKLGKGHVGTIPLKSATAEIKDGKIKSGTFVMDMKNFDVTDLSGKWKTKFLDHVRSGDFFQADKYGEAKLEIKEQIGTNKVKADLTIKETTKEVIIDFKKEGKKYSGKLVFDRTKFGVNYGSGSIYSTLGADKIIKDEIELDFVVVLK